MTDTVHLLQGFKLLSFIFNTLIKLSLKERYCTVFISFCFSLVHKVNLPVSNFDTHLDSKKLSSPSPKPQPKTNKVPKRRKEKGIWTQG